MPETEISSECLAPAFSRRQVVGLAVGATITGLVGSLALSSDAAEAASWEYIFPTTGRHVSRSFAAHVAKGSTAPGTDYGYGGVTNTTKVVAVKAGTVTVAKTTNSGTYGRQVHINHGDGTTTKYMHLSSVSVAKGATVKQGAKIGVVGGSAEGSNTRWGAHLHICLVAGGKYVDFAKRVQNKNYPGGLPMAPWPTSPEPEPVPEEGYPGDEVDPSELGETTP